MPNKNRICRNCLHSVRVGALRKPDPVVDYYTLYEGKLRCTYEPAWCDVAPDHYCGHHKLDVTQEFEIPLERYQAPVERRMDSDESL